MMTIGLVRTPKHHGMIASASHQELAKRNGATTMIDITTRKCEQATRHGYSVCGDTVSAVFDDNRWEYETKLNVASVTLACKRHAAGLRRRNYAPEELDPLTVMTQKLITDRDTATKAFEARNAIVKAEKTKAHELARQSIALEAWESVRTEWTTTMVVETGDRWGGPETSVVVHVHAVGDELGGWNRCEVSIEETRDEPAVVKISGGSPMTISTSAAVALSSALAIVSQLVDELNA